MVHAGVGWVIQGCVMQGWGRSYRGGVGHAGVGWVTQGSDDTENYHHLHTVLLVITGGSKFNYNHTHNYLQLLREHKFNYNHKLRLGYFLLSTKRET